MSDRLVEIARAANDGEAAVIKAHLESVGIRSSIDGQAVAGWMWHLGSQISGIRVLVFESDAERAYEVLEGRDDSPHDEVDDAKHPPAESWDDEERDDALELLEDESKRAFRSAVIGIVLLPPLLTLYSVWVLFRHRLFWVGTERSRQRAMFAGAINCAVLAIVFLLLQTILADGHVEVSDDPNTLPTSGTRWRIYR
ncbi:MAG: DUF2007 domain-containing protein [Pirellulaceae bacterium]|jgi:hypothetical protein|nr:DUF2007 domain-containing protein [Pirellulaceae bacterium]MDP7016279.1 DUF2007 domain-containing protein [Pirellulaceae bacterium]